VPWQVAPLLPLAVTFAGGLVAAAWLPGAPLALLPAAALSLTGAIAALALGRDGAAGLLLLAAVVALGALRPGPSLVTAEHVARLPLPVSLTVEGEIAAEPVRWAPDRARLLLDAMAFQDGGERKPLMGRVQLTVYGESIALGPGQRIMAEVRLHRPVGFRNPGAFDYPAHLRREGILVVGSARGDRLEAITPDDPPWPIRVKRWAVDTISRQLPPAAAGLLAGLLLGERATMPRDADEAFRRAGVYHVLAVSGFNVALLASCVFLTLSLLGLPRRPTAVVAGGALVAFALVVGGHPSVLRATVMGLGLLLAVLLDREPQLLNGIALAALLLLAWRPADLWDPGFQLSFGATMGIILLAPPVTGFLTGRGWSRWLAAPIAVSLGAQLAVTPIMLGHFNQLSLIGVLANLAVVPLAGVATALGLVALLASLISEAGAELFFNALWLLLLLLRGAVRIAASLPAAMVHLPAPILPATAGWYAALALLPWSASSRPARRGAVALALLAGALSAWPWLRPEDGRLRITFLDVGQGDATLIELPGRRRILVDAGAAGPYRFDVGEHVVAPFLWNRPAGRLDVVALSHSDPDHSGGLRAVMRGLRVGEFWENGYWYAGSEAALRAVERSGAIRRILARGQRLWVGDALVTVLHPAGPLESENDLSLVLRLDWRGVSVLLTGDLARHGEAAVLERAEPVRALLLKVAHHGSRFSTGAAFLEASRPAFAVISAGARNPFRHPAPETLDRLAASGARVYRTDRDGAVIVETDGVTLSVTRWARGTTERFELDPERAPEGTERTAESTAAPGDRGP
jgi:competence protein ComEC